MTLRQWTIIGVIATAIIAVALPLYALAEADRMTRAQAQLLAESVEQGEVIYAENCVVCHGTAGEGISAYPALDNDGVRQMEYSDIFKVIERGRYDTAMAPWGVNEGGVLNNMEIDQLIVMIQQGDWAQTAHTVDHLGLSPPTVISVEVSDDTLAELSSLPHGDVIAAALPVYAANCTGCHGANGEGTSIAPALNASALRQKSDEELTRIVADGVSGTLMAGWNQALDAQEIANLVGLIRYWDEVPTELIPQPELSPIASTDTEVIAAGEKLYNVACANCHGSDGQGTRMAPALNAQNFLTETNDLAIKAIIAQGVSDTRMPAWGGRLSDEQLNALVSFIRAWEPNAPAVAEPTLGR
ncbi:MAG: c-type cytochrome [Anaerolineales bacterium]|nr:c-type cytochrome [Anaerolineales bacterium]